jgi:hypothetical protein
MNFNEQPSGRVGALSSMIYQAYDSLYASAGFYYEFKVFAWSGTTTIPANPNATIQKFPDQFGSGRAWIDVHKIVQQQLTSDFFTDGTYKPNIGGGACYVAVKVQGKYTAGSTSVVTSNTVLATMGYVYTSEGFNASLTGPVFTDKETFYITEGAESYYIWYDADVITGITIGATTITPNTVSTSSTKIQGVDLIQLLSAASVSGNTNVTFTTASTSYVFPIVRNCLNRYGNVTAHFLNKWGVYDSYCFNAVSKKTQNVSSEIYEKPIYRQTDLSQAWDYGVQVMTPFNVNAKTQLTINTNWIPENDNQVIQQMFLSSSIIVDDFSARVTDSAFAEKKRVNDKLIDYTIQLEFNQPLINKIVR